MSAGLIIEVSSLQCRVSENCVNATPYIFLDSSTRISKSTCLKSDDDSSGIFTVAFASHVRLDTPIINGSDGNGNLRTLSDESQK